MNCKQARKLLVPYLDGELSQGEREELLEHLSGCKRCREELKAAGFLQRRLSYALKDTAEDRSCPNYVWLGVQQRLVAEEEPFRRRRVTWRTAVASVLVVALAVSLVITMLLGGETPEVIAKEAVENSPRIQEHFGKEIEVKVTEITGQTANVMFLGDNRLGKAEVTLDSKQVTGVEVLNMPGLTEEEREKAIEIAGKDHQVKELLAKGGTIGAVFPHVIVSEDEEVIRGALVETILKDGRWTVSVNLPDERVEKVEKAQEASLAATIEYETQELTGEERKEAISIAKSNSDVNELLSEGASISRVELVSWHLTWEKDGEEEIKKKVMVMLQGGNTRWAVQVNLAEKEVEKVRESLPVAEGVKLGVEALAGSSIEDIHYKLMPEAKPVATIHMPGEGENVRIIAKDAEATEEEREKAKEIAFSSPKVQARIKGWKYEIQDIDTQIRITEEGKEIRQDKVQIGIRLPEINKIFIVEVDLGEEKVTYISLLMPIPQAPDE
ncbi:MAG: zf-HC2 domain-containing protein [Dehalococcoidia bacterium]